MPQNGCGDSLNVCRRAPVGGVVLCVLCAFAWPAATHGDGSGRLTVGSLPVSAEGVPNLPVRIQTGGPSSPAPRGPCSAQALTHATSNFSGTFTGAIPLGFVGSEIAAVSFTVPATDFPFVLDMSEIIFAQSHFNATTTEWTYMVWEGTPDAGLPIVSFSSDGLAIPHVQLPAGAANAVNLQVSVDPGDPAQIVVDDNGTQTFSIGFRIDAMNNPPTQSCGVICILPAECCPHDVNTNAWPGMDQSGPEFGAQNWLFARDCPGALQGCFIGPGWVQLTEAQIPGVSAFFNDWAIRVTYTPINCVPSPGACCNADGTCTDSVLEPDCTASGGVFQGQNTTCAQVGQCPEPVGACCFGPQNCLGLTEANCTLAVGTWQGPNTACVPVTGECPLGACCLPDGSCVDNVSGADCAAMNGLYQGDLTDCAGTNCPQPLGACCLSTGGCLDLTLGDCNVIPGAIWAGPLTTCPGDCCAGPDGDINGDGLTNGPDIAAFVAAVLGNPTPGEVCRGDFDGMNGLGPGDIPGLVAALLAG